MFPKSFKSKMHFYNSLPLASRADSEDEKLSEELEGSERQIVSSRRYCSRALKWLPWSLHLVLLALYATLLARMKIWLEPTKQTSESTHALGLEHI
jgi:hypothetical protein